MLAFTERQTAIAGALKLFSRALPLFQDRLDPPAEDDLRQMVAAWEIALEGFCPEIIGEAAKRVIRTMANDGRNICPTAPLLAKTCKEVSYEFYLKQKQARDSEEPDALIGERRYVPPEGLAEFFWSLTAEEKAKLSDLRKQGVSIDNCMQIIRKGREDNDSQ